jgi:hypothetical protein
MIRFVLIALFALVLHFSGNCQPAFSSAVPHSTAAPAWSPSASGSRLAVDYAAKKLYIHTGSAWLEYEQGIDQITGSVAPAYTPAAGQSLWAVNAVPELYHYSGGAWHCIGCEVAISTDATLTGDGTDGSPLDIAQQGATTGQVLKWDGDAWSPEDDLNTGTTYYGGGAIEIVNDTIDIAQQGATAGQVLKWDGDAWSPANDSVGGGSSDNDAAGVIRGELQGSTNSVQTIIWTFLTGANHAIRYFDTVYVDPASNELVVQYPATTNVMTFMSQVDEQFSKYGIICGGASVGTTEARFIMYRLSPRYIVMVGNGTTWTQATNTTGGATIAYDSSSGIFTINTTNDNAVLTDAQSQGSISNIVYGSTTTSGNFNATGMYFAKYVYSPRGFYEMKFALVDYAGTKRTGSATTSEYLLINFTPAFTNLEIRTFDSRTSQQNKNFWNSSNIWLRGLFE